MSGYNEESESSGLSEADLHAMDKAIDKMVEIDERADGSNWDRDVRRLEEVIRKINRRYHFLRDQSNGDTRYYVQATLLNWVGWRDDRTPNYENAGDLANLAAEIACRFVQNDYEYFEEIARILAIRGGKRGGKRGRPMMARLIEAAEQLQLSLDRNPTREELKAEAERRGIEISDWPKTLRNCNLDFLEGRRGRPRKNPD